MEVGCLFRFGYLSGVLYSLHVFHLVLPNLPKVRGLYIDFIEFEGHQILLPSRSGKIPTQKNKFMVTVLESLTGTYLSSCGISQHDFPIP